MSNRVGKDEIQKANDTHIIDYIKSKGENLKEEGKYHRLAEHDSLIINNNGKWFWNSRNVGNFGSISFAREFYGLSFQDAVRDIKGQEISNEANYGKVEDDRPFEYPYQYEKNTQDNAIRYLQKERGISEGTITTLIQSGIIAEDQKNNVVFKWKDRETGEITGAERLGTEPMEDGNHFKQIVANSKYDGGFEFQVGKPNKIAFFESPVDALSYYEMYKPTNTRFKAMSGLKDRSAARGIKDLAKELQQDNKEIEKVIIAVDNDEAGNNFANKWVNMFNISERHTPYENDWNDDLKMAITQSDYQKRPNESGNKKYTRKKSPEKRKQEIESLADKFAEQVDNHFTSEEKLREHLQFMSKFHKYSTRNMTLIDQQFKGARAVGSFNFWKDQGASVKKGEKGIKILAPAPVNYYNKEGEWKQTKYASKEDKQKIKNGDYETKKKTFFKVGHVFEYTQTDAREKGLETSDIFQQYHRDGTIENDKAIMSGLEKVADNLEVEILDKPLTELGTAKGVSYPPIQSVALNPRNSDYENVGVLIHELAHAKLHTTETRDNYTKAEKEFQAEMTAFVVADHYDIDTQDFSLSYLKAWTKDADMEDKEKLLNDVKETANEFITVIDEELEQYQSMEFEQKVESENQQVENNPSIENDKVSAKSNTMNMENSSFETQLDSLKYENETLKENINLKDEKMSSLNTEYKNLSLQKNELAEEMNNYSESNKELNQKVKTLTANNHQLYTQLEEMKSFIKNNHVVLDEFTKEYSNENEQGQEQEQEENEEQQEEPYNEKKTVTNERTL